MKTNQMLTVNFGGHSMSIEHKTGMGNLTELWGIGNAYRAQRGLEPLDLKNWLRRPQTEEFVRVVENRLAISRDIEVIENPKKKDGHVATIKSPLINSNRGRYGGTYAHWYIMLDAALYLASNELKLSIFDTITDIQQVIKQLDNFEIPQEVAESVQKPLYVYAIRETSTGNVKLGISTDPNERLRQLQTGNSSQLELVAYKQAQSYQDEKRQHRLNHKYHVRGEWFNSRANLID